MGSKTMMTDAYEQFACIGGICPDNCCIGWQVELDKKTFQSYQQIQDRELSRKIKRYVYRNEEGGDPAIDYGLVELLPDRRCPFLQQENLCSIQLQKGETFLSNVCAGYPRMINRVEGVLEYSLTLSCPEAAQLVLNREKPLRWISGEGVLGRRQILNVDYRATDYPGHLLGENLLMLRDRTLSILQNREHSLTRRIHMLGDFFENLEPRQKMDADIALKPLDKLLFWEEIHTRFNTPSYIDSQRYLTLMKSPVKALDFLGFPETLEFILENYLVNYVFQNLFPAGESEKGQDAFFKLGIRYALVKFGAMKLSASEKPLSRDLLINLIQCFSKATEHHFTYFDDILATIKKEVPNHNYLRSYIEL